MRLVFATNEQLARRVEKHGEGYLAAITPAVVERTPDGYRFDMDHPAWQTTEEAYPRPLTPCPKCGESMRPGCRRQCGRCGYVEGCGG